VEWLRRPPIVAGLIRADSGSKVVDEDISYIAGELTKAFGDRVVEETIVHRGVNLAARTFSFNPLQKYLRGLVWDGVKRLNGWLTRYVAAADSVYASTVGRWWLVSAVARALEPGCQADNVIVLEGHEGAGKSATLRILGGDWHLGRLPNLRDAERAAALMQGKWIIELGELDALRGAAETAVKDFLTQVADTYRKPYARVHVTIRRSQVFAGTTNESQYITESGEARRFWPVRVGTCDTVALKRDRDQLIAEAVAAFRAGERWYPQTNAEREMLFEQREERRTVDIWEERVLSWIGERVNVSIAEVLIGCLNLEPAKHDRKEQMRIASILKRAGRERVRVGTHYGRSWVYQLPQGPVRDANEPDF
jgi:predicted P-loop ATPase